MEGEDAQDGIDQSGLADFVRLGRPSQFFHLAERLGCLLRRFPAPAGNDPFLMKDLVLLPGHSIC